VLDVGDRRVRLDEVSEPRPGQRFAFVMDTRLCDAAFDLARDADLLVCESTFLECDADLAERFGHLTARQAARIAAESGARRLVLTHFSQRYGDDATVYLDEARQVFDDVIGRRRPGRHRRTAPRRLSGAPCGRCCAYRRPSAALTRCWLLSSLMGPVRQRCRGEPIVTWRRGDADAR
jgi:ribonuclease Z